MSDRDWINAKEELEKAIKDKKPIYGYFKRDPGFLSDRNSAKVVFREPLEFPNWLDKLNFNYDCGFGGQELYGVVVFSDGTWLSRGEYDGSEWWEFNQLPTLEEVIKEEEVD